MTQNRIIAVAAATLCAAASSAFALDVIAEFQYQNLAAQYVSSSATTGTFSALAVANPSGLQSEGRVSRNVATEGTASFEPGYVASNPFAGFSITLSVNKTGVGVGTGSGSFVITDADGDTMTGDVSDGAWNLNNTGFPFIAFQGTLSNVVFNDNGAADGIFNGTDLPIFSDNFAMGGFPATAPYAGALVVLSFDINTFFSSDFSYADDIAAQVSGDIVPAPGALALLGLGGVVAGRRRR